MDVKAVFKRKAIELATKLQGRFPMKLVFVVPALTAADETELYDMYRLTVHDTYASKIQDRDESFFMTTSDLDDPMQLVGILRGIWSQMGAADRDAVWKYMDIFERLASVGSSSPR